MPPSWRCRRSWRGRAAEEFRRTPTNDHGPDIPSAHDRDRAPRRHLPEHTARTKTRVVPECAGLVGRGARPRIHGRGGRPLHRLGLHRPGHLARARRRLDGRCGHQRRATLQRAANWSHDAGASHGIGGETVGGYGESFEFVRGQVHWDDPWAWGWNDTASAAASVATLNPAPFLGNLTSDYFTTAQQNRTNDVAAVAALRAHEEQTRNAVDTFPSIVQPPAGGREGIGPNPGGRDTVDDPPAPPVSPAGGPARRGCRRRGRCRRDGRGRPRGRRQSADPPRRLGIGRRRAVHRPGRGPYRAVGAGGSAGG